MQRGTAAPVSTWSQHKDPLLALYAFNAGLLALKMLILAVSTGVARKIKKVTPNPEDAAAMGVSATLAPDPLVERIKRAHSNDLENIPIFLLVSLAYIHTLPNPALCHSLFWIFTAARFLHSLIYAFFPLPQPIRTLLYFVGVGITVFMIFANFIHFINYL